jgi:hypothetical protein
MRRYQTKRFTKITTETKINAIEFQKDPFFLLHFFLLGPAVHEAQK